MKTPAGSPPPPPRLLLDVMLGRLARRLRALGYDAAYDNAADDPGLVRRAARERRVLVTRDTRIAPPRRGPRVVLLRANDTPALLRELAGALPLPPPPGLFTRCTACNARLRRARADEVEARAPDHVRRTQREFRACPGCGRLYWPGTHRARLVAELEAALPGVTTAAPAPRPAAPAPAGPAPPRPRRPTPPRRP